MKRYGVYRKDTAGVFGLCAEALTSELDAQRLARSYPVNKQATVIEFDVPDVPKEAWVVVAPDGEIRQVYLNPASAERYSHSGDEILHMREVRGDK